MFHNLLLNASFHHRLRQLDQEKMASVRAQGCRFCSGQLHQANFPRVGFGIPGSMRHFYQVRFSLCCSQCRRRTTPPSVRFLGARRFAALVMVLMCAQRSGAKEKRLDRIRCRVGLSISLTTWKRWRKWWKEAFPVTSLWRQVKGLFVSQDELSTFPGDLLKLLKAPRLLNFLRLISPLSTQVI